MIILDTNVLSELLHPRPAASVVSWLERQRRAEIFTTSITQAEMLYGVELMPRGKRQRTLIEAVEAIFSVDMAGRILPFDSDAARTFATIAARRRSLGRPISNSDAQIAAIAQMHGAVLATHDLHDFEDCGIRLIDPWLV